MASSPLPTRTCIACEMNDTTERWLRMHSHSEATTSCQCKCDCDYNCVYYSNIELFIDALLSSFMSSHNELTRAPHRNRNECNANRNVLFDCCVSAGDDGWRSTRLKFHAQKDLYIIEFAPLPPSPQTTDFIRN